MNLAEQIIEKIALNNNKEQIFYNGKRISGKEVINETLLLSKSFQQGGIKPEQRVLLLMQDKPSFVYSFLALLSIGSIPVPLNPKIETEILEFILADSRAVGAIVEAEEYERVVKFLKSSMYVNKDFIIVDDEAANCINTDIEENNRLNFWSQIRTDNSIHFSYYHKKPSSIAFWQYTSGTTGMPKAVQHSQEAMLINTNRFAMETIGITKEDCVFSIPKMFFGYGLGNSLFFPLLTGASIILESEWPTLDKIKQNITEYKPTVFFAVPKIYSLILRNKEYFKKEYLGSVRLFFSAGAQLPTNLNKDWEQWCGKYIVNGIGCTEIGHVFLCNRANAVVPELSGWTVSGYNIKLTSLEKQEEEVPLGTIGELCIKSPYDYGRYWENPKSNCLKFKNEWYYSGDLCIKDESGGYMFLGRKDNLFKINGRWVNPEEVESKAMNLLPIEECSMIEVDDEYSLTIPVLFVVKKKDAFLSEYLIKQVLEKHLNGYKCPKYIFFIDELPKNANGKVSRGAIKTMYNNTYINTINKVSEEQKA